MIRHWCCEHSAVAIMRTGVVKPHPHPLLGRTLSWWSSLENPTREDLCLTNSLLKCNRMEYVFTAISTESLIPWPEYMKRLKGSARLNADVLNTYGAWHDWLVAESPVPVADRGPLLSSVMAERFPGVVRR